MIRVAIVDDDPAGRAVLLAHLKRFQDEAGQRFSVRTFTDGAELADGYTPDLDLIFLDVMMDEMNGFEAARAVRELDERVAIVFVTNMAQFAIRGYEVNAMSYLVKPVPYFAFSQELARLLKRIHRENATTQTVMVPTATGTALVELAHITYVESRKHRLMVHTLERTYTFNGTLKSYEAELADKDFFRSNNSYLVNLRHVRGIGPSTCTMAGGDELAVSRTRRKAFLEALTNYVAEGRGAG